MQVTILFYVIYINHIIYVASRIDFISDGYLVLLSPQSLGFECSICKSDLPSDSDVGCFENII